jgi:hypothetical protein
MADATVSTLPPAVQWRLDRLNRTLGAMFEEMGRYDEALLNRSPGPGKWSAIQVMHHVLLAEEMSLRYLRKKLSSPSDIPRTSWGSRWRTFLLWFYLSSPIKAKAPAGVSDEALPAHATLAETQARWLELRRQTSAFLNELKPELFGREVYRHPFAGRLPVTGMLDFFYWHFARHYQQVLKALGPV